MNVPVDVVTATARTEPVGESRCRSTVSCGPNPAPVTRFSVVPGAAEPATTFQATVIGGAWAVPPHRPVESTVLMVMSSTSPPRSDAEENVGASVPAPTPFTVQA